MAWVAGVDGCRGGWFVALRHRGDGLIRLRLVASFDDIVSLPEAPEVIAIDMPIGLLSVPEPGGRECDRQARALLGPLRGRSVFSPPIRPALEAVTFAEALAIGRRSAGAGSTGGISLQCFRLFPKLREVDDRMTPELQSRVREVHPELSFHQLNGGPLLYGKRSTAGRASRQALLRRVGLAEGPGPWPRSAVAPDDVADALIASWSAERIACGAATRLPAAPTRDARGLLMEIWR